MSKSTNIITEKEIKAVAVPAKTDSYTPISHGWIIDKCKSGFAKKGFDIINDIYSTNHNGNIARCTYVLKDKTTGFTLTFSWVNSYDKSTKFQCAVGGYNDETDASFIPEHMNNWIRKHTGIADVEANKIITEQIDKINDYKDQLITIKNLFVNTKMTEDEFLNFLCKLFFKYNMLGSEELNAIRQEINKPSFTCQCDLESVWYKYNIVLSVIKDSHPKTWILKQTFINTLLTNLVNNKHKVVSTVAAKEIPAVELNAENIEVIQEEWEVKESIVEEEELDTEEILDEVIEEEIIDDEVLEDIQEEIEDDEFDIESEEEIVEEVIQNEDIQEDDDLDFDTEESIEEEILEEDEEVEDEEMEDETIVEEDLVEEVVEAKDSEDEMFDVYDSGEIELVESPMTAARGVEFELEDSDEELEIIDENETPWEEDSESPVEEEVSSETTSNSSIKEKIELYLSDLFDNEPFTFTKQGSAYLVTLDNGIEMEIEESDLV